MEDGDFVELHMQGEVSLEDMRQITTLMDRLIETHGTYGLLADVTAMRGLAPDARRFASSWQNVSNGYGSAVYGASLPVRTVLTLLSRAMELLQKKPVRTELQFFKNETDARTWLMQKRAQSRR